MYFQIIKVANEELITPFLLNFEVTDFIKTLDDPRNQLQLVPLQLEVMLDALLEDEVAEVALDYFMKARRAAEFFQNFLLEFQRSTINTCLNELGGELVQRQPLEMPCHLVIDGLAHAKVIEVDDLLHDKIAKLMLHILQRIDNDVVHHSLLLLCICFCVFNDLFHDAESVLVLGELFEIVADVIEDLLTDALWIGGDDQVDHVVALFILGEPGDVVISHESVLDDLELFVLSGSVQDVLEGPRAFLIAGNLYEFLARNLLEEVNSLMRLQILNQLGAEKVAILPNHQVGQFSIHLINDLIDQRLVRRLQVIL